MSKKKRQITSYPPKGMKCPKCNTQLKFSNRTLIVNDKGTRNAPVARCASCQRYYTYQENLRNHKISLDNMPVRWISHERTIKRGKIARKYLADMREQKKDLQHEIQRHKIEMKSRVENNDKEDQIPEFARSIVLSQIPVFQNTMRICPFCKSSVEKVHPVRYIAFSDNKSVEMYAYARVCLNCEITLMDEGQIRELQHQANEKHIFTVDAGKFANPQEMMRVALAMPALNGIEKENAEPLPFEGIINQTENLSTGNKTVFIYAHKCHCNECRKKYRRDTIRNRTAMVQTISGRTIGVNVMFCAGCGKYYLNLKAFQQYKKAHKGLLFECVFLPDISAKESAWLGFAPDSILSRYGYNVKADTDEVYRQTILRYLLDTRKATKYEIIEKLSEFIEIRSNRADMVGAIEKWRADIHYVSEYRIAEQPKVHNVNFKQGRKNRG